MTITVRPARHDDYPAIAAIGAELQAVHAAGRPDVFRPGANPFPAEYFAAHLNADPPTVYVAEGRENGENGENGACGVIGYLLLSVRLSPAYDIMPPRRIATVEQIGVREVARGQGTGRALMATAEVWARAREADVLRLHVWEFNTDARAFYTRVGMVTESRTMEMPLRNESAEGRVPRAE